MHLFAKAHRGVFVALLLILVVYQASFLYFGHLSTQNPFVPSYPIFAGDSEKYVEMSESLLAGAGLAGDDGQLQRAYPPAYPVFLAFSRVTTGGFLFAAIVQMLATAGAAFLIYQMALRFVSRGWAIGAALLYGLDPSVIFASTTLFTDALFSATIVVVVYLCFFAEWSSALWRLALAGFLLGIAILMRPIGEFLILVLSALHLVYAYASSREGTTSSTMRKSAGPLAVFVIAALIVVGPWVYRNYVIFGAAEIAHVGANNLLYYNARQFLLFESMHTLNPLAALKAARAQTSPDLEAIDMRIAQELEENTPEGESSANYEGAVAKKLILEHPILYGYYHSINMIPFFIGSSIAAYQQYAQQAKASTGFYAPTFAALAEALRAMKAALSSFDPLAFFAASRAIAPIALEMCFWAIATLFALYGVIAKWRDPRILLFALLIVYFAFLTGPVAIARYRVPAEPYLFILAAVGVSLLVHALRTRGILSPRKR